MTKTTLQLPMRLAGLVLAVALLGCANPCYVLQVDGHYAIHAPLTTPSGIVEEGADPLLLDRLTDDVERCLLPLGPFKCGALPIDRSSFRVMVARDFIQLDDGEQVLPTAMYRGGGGGCEAKGLTGLGPCRWRAFLQPDRIIVVTPNLKLYGDPLVRFITGRQDIWTDAALARCATQQEAPLVSP